MQVRCDLRIADHVWQDECAAVAATFDNLGAGFRPALRKGGLAYNKKAYPDAAAGRNPAIGQGTLFIADAELDGHLAGSSTLFASPSFFSVFVAEKKEFWNPIQWEFFKEIRQHQALLCTG